MSGYETNYIVCHICSVVTLVHLIRCSQYVHGSVFSEPIVQFVKEVLPAEFCFMAE